MAGCQTDQLLRHPRHDSDGQGRTKIDGAVLTGGVVAVSGGNVWTSADGRHTYVATGDLATGATLLIDGVLTVENYHTGQLGLTLEGAPAVTPPAASRNIVGSNDNDIVLRMVRRSDGTLLQVAYSALAGVDDNDHILGLAGTDYLEAGGGSNLLEGGAGADNLITDGGVWYLYENTPYWNQTVAGYGNDDLFTDDRIDLARLPSFADFGGTVGSG